VETKVVTLTLNNSVGDGVLGRWINDAIAGGYTVLVKSGADDETSDGE